ncbi:MAG: prepilin-type N-terminal cleavage/methylation domain-containing protein [Armatimonadetes bacterium]|nr:prepilin-type N-terminal cleavage/methylation domain-containing protein [Armatimonadota bacterium]
MLAKKRRYGFSLVEALLAIVIVAMGLVAVAATLGWVTRNGAAIRYRTVAATLADSEVEALEAKPALPSQKATYIKTVGRPATELPDDARMTVTSVPHPKMTEKRLRHVTVVIEWGANEATLGGKVVRERLICLR